MFNSIGLVAKHGDPRVQDALQRLIDYLLKRGLQVRLDRNSAAVLPQHRLPEANTLQLGECDLIITVGGDGTLLQAARRLVEHDTHILGINLGRLGFLTDISPLELESRLDKIFAGDFKQEARFLLRAEVFREDVSLGEAVALNDVVLHKWNMAHMVSFNTTINGYFLSSQRSDGVIVSTPTGSSAYALSGGGPILHPALNALVLVSICPHTLSYRPIVVNGDSQLEISLLPNQQAEAQMTCDGVLCHSLLPGDRVVIKKYKNIQLIHPREHDAYSVWRAKLGWGKE